MISSFRKCNRFTSKCPRFPIWQILRLSHQFFCVSFSYKFWACSIIDSRIYSGTIWSFRNFNSCGVRSICCFRYNFLIVTYTSRRIKSCFINWCFLITWYTIYLNFVLSFRTITISNISWFKFNNYIWTFSSWISCEYFFNPFISGNIFSNSPTFSSWFILTAIKNFFSSIMSSSTLR